jgi:hypothetical protein
MRVDKQHRAERAANCHVYARRVLGAEQFYLLRSSFAPVPCRCVRIFAMHKQVIEYAGEPVGIAVPENGKLKFIAVKYHVMDLDEQVFPTTEEVRTAIHRLVVHKPPQHLHS